MSYLQFHFSCLHLVYVRMAEWSKAPDSSSGLRKRAWVQIPLLTNFLKTGLSPLMHVCKVLLNIFYSC
ncbi:hypothetical protein GQ457_07G044570 [Hibiscus cannabinus]